MAHDHFGPNDQAPYLAVTMLAFIAFTETIELAKKHAGKSVFARDGVEQDAVSFVD